MPDRITATIYGVTQHDKSGNPIDETLMAARRRDDLYWTVLNMLKDYRIQYVTIKPLHDLEEREA